MKKRKASLQLSIDAIVVLIMAITILGLGLGFIRSQFKTVTGKFGEVTEQMEQEMIKKIKESGELVTFDQFSFDLERGVKRPLYMAIFNSGQRECFMIRFFCIDAMLGGSSAVNVNDCPGEVDTTGGAPPNWGWFSTYQSRILGPNEVVVLPIVVQTQGAPVAGNYNGKVVVRRTNTASDSAVACPDDTVDPFDASDGNYDNPEHGSKEFFVNLR